MKLNVDISKLLEAAEKIEGLQEDYSAELLKVVNCLESTESYWKGKDAEKYIQQVMNYPNQLKKLNELVAEYASFLRVCASSYDEVDSEIFNRISNC